MAHRPIIGITLECRLDPSDERSQGDMKLNWNYAQAVVDAGGAPILIPPQTDASTIAPVIDGWLIPGGLDIDASRFGQANHDLVELQDPARYASESALFDQLPTETPILGICYGCQFLNVKMGGTLEQHIPDRLGGDDRHSGGTLDAADLDPDSKLGCIMGPRVVGKSYHHQAIERVADGLKVVGRHADGTIEAIESVDRPWVIGVQWHPERTQQSPETKRLFAAFIAAAAAFRERRERALV